MKTRLGVRVSTYPYPLPADASFAYCGECGKVCIAKVFPNGYEVICVACFIAAISELKQAALEFAADPLPLTQHIRDTISAVFGKPKPKLHDLPLEERLAHQEYADAQEEADDDRTH